MTTESKPQDGKTINSDTFFGESIDKITDRMVAGTLESMQQKLADTPRAYGVSGTFALKALPKLFFNMYPPDYDKILECLREIITYGKANDINNLNKFLRQFLDPNRESETITHLFTDSSSPSLSLDNLVLTRLSATNDDRVIRHRAENVLFEMCNLMSMTLFRFAAAPKRRRDMGAVNNDRTVCEEPLLALCKTFGKLGLKLTDSNENLQKIFKIPSVITNPNVVPAVGSADGKGVLGRNDNYLELPRALWPLMEYCQGLFLKSKNERSKLVALAPELAIKFNKGANEVLNNDASLLPELIKIILAYVNRYQEELDSIPAVPKNTDDEKLVRMAVMHFSSSQSTHTSSSTMMPSSQSTYSSSSMPSSLYEDEDKKHGFSSSYRSVTTSFNNSSDHKHAHPLLIPPAHEERMPVNDEMARDYLKAVFQSLELGLTSSAIDAFQGIHSFTDPDWQANWSAEQSQILANLISDEMEADFTNKTSAAGIYLLLKQSGIFENLSARENTPQDIKSNVSTTAASTSSTAGMTSAINTDTISASSSSALSSDSSASSYNSRRDLRQRFLDNLAANTRTRQKPESGVATQLDTPQSDSAQTQSDLNSTFS